MADCAKPKPRPMSERFKNAVEIIRSLPEEGSFQPSNHLKLKFYALYKQVMEGPCSRPKPAFWDAVGRAKWEAWSMCGKMSKDLATQMYVEEIQQLVETMPQSPVVEQFMTSIGPYYESVSHLSTAATDHDELDLSRSDLGSEVVEEKMSPPDSEDSDIYQESFQQFLSPQPSEPSGPSGQLHMTERSNSSSGARDYYTNPTDSPLPTSQCDNQSGDASQIQSPRHNSLDSEALNHVISQVQAVQSRLQSVLRQLTNLASSSNAGQSSRTNRSNQVPFWRSSLFSRLVPFLLSWPFIVRFIVTLLSKRFGSSPTSSTVGWMWLVTFLNTACSVTLVVFLAHQHRTET